MPYRLSKRGAQLLRLYNTPDEPDWVIQTWKGLTNHEHLAMMYFRTFSIEPTPTSENSNNYTQTYIKSSEIAVYYRLAPQAMRGPCAQLKRLGLLEKPPGE